MADDAKADKATEKGKKWMVKSTARALNPFDRIEDIPKFIREVGDTFYGSKMFGCRNVGQGRVMAMAWMLEQKNPLEFSRTYDIIEGKVSMKSDAMLAEFRNRGGDHTMITRTSEKAEVELRVGRKKNTFSFTWEEAQAESYIYGKPDKRGDKVLKDNWSTPRRRMQMLWARLVSDSVRVMMPEVNAGLYTPEELGSGENDDDDVIDASYEVVLDEPAAAESPTVAEPEPANDTPQTETAEPESKPADVTVQGVTREQLLAMKAMKDELQLGPEQWAKVIGKFGVASAKSLEAEQGDRVIGWLTKRKEKLDKVQKEKEKLENRDDLSKWADEQLGK